MALYIEMQVTFQALRSTDAACFVGPLVEKERPRVDLSNKRPGGGLEHAAQVCWLVAVDHLGTPSQQVPGAIDNCGQLTISPTLCWFGL